MEHPQMIAHLFSQTVAGDGSDGTEPALLQLPLNLIALIVTFVR